jgi:two-component system CheB/CheR fusion protein
LIELNNDLDNLITSTRIGTLFLDENLTIRRFTPEIKRIFKILDSDIGRPANHFFHTLNISIHSTSSSQVANNATEQECGRSAPRMALVSDARSALSHRHECAPSGVVLTFTDINLLKTTREA